MQSRPLHIRRCAPATPAATKPLNRALQSDGALQGKGNLSPYSYFNVMSHDPPYVTIGCTHTRQRPNHMKDSEQNLLETGCAAWRRTEHARLPELQVCLPPAILFPLLPHPCNWLCTLYACSASKARLFTCITPLSVLQGIHAEHDQRVVCGVCQPHVSAPDHLNARSEQGMCMCASPIANSASCHGGVSCVMMSSRAQKAVRPQVRKL